MSNHIHLILEPTVSSLSAGVHGFAGRYAQYFNRRHKLRGHLFQDRFRSLLIEDGEYLKRLTRYIHLNPVRANIVAVPQNYQWSSYCSYIALEEITWLTQKRVLLHFGVTEQEARQAMARYTLQMIDAEHDVGLVRESTQLGAFGSDEFIKRTVGVKTASGMSKIRLSDLVAVAQVEFRYCADEIISDSREKHLVDIRSILALAVKKVPGLYLQQLAQYLNRDSSSLCRLVRRAKQSQDLEERTEKLLEQIILKS